MLHHGIYILHDLCRNVHVTTNNLLRRVQDQSILNLDDPFVFFYLVRFLTVNSPQSNEYMD